MALGVGRSGKDRDTGDQEPRNSKSPERRRREIFIVRGAIPVHLPLSEARRFPSRFARRCFQESIRCDKHFAASAALCLATLIVIFAGGVLSKLKPIHSGFLHQISNHEENAPARYRRRY